MKRSELNEAELACLEYYEEESKHSESSILKVFNHGKSISEQLEPEVKKVDMSKFIDSDVLMEFFGNEILPNKKYDFLVSRNRGFNSYIDMDGEPWLNCQPKLNYVNAWLGGGGNPLPKGLWCKVYFVTGGYSEILSDDIPANYWSSNSVGTTILAFEILGLADGWSW